MVIVTVEPMSAFVLPAGSCVMTLPVPDPESATTTDTWKPALVSLVFASASRSPTTAGMLAVAVLFTQSYNPFIYFIF